MDKLFRFMAVPMIAALGALFMVAPQTGGDVTVKIVARAGGGYRFEPSAVHIERGERVEFINETRATHTVTCKGCSWDTGDLQPGQVVFKSFTTPGSEAFVCRYHPGVESGTLLVGPK